MRRERKTSQEGDRILERETGFEPATLALAIRKVMLLKGLIGAWFPHFSLISQHVSEIYSVQYVYGELPLSKSFITNLAQVKLN